jgi:hypothetical protein
MIVSHALSVNIQNKRMQMGVTIVSLALTQMQKNPQFARIARLVSIRLIKRHPSVLFAKLINSTAMSAKFRVYRVRLGMLLPVVNLFVNHALSENSRTAYRKSAQTVPLASTGLRSVYQLAMSARLGSTRAWSKLLNARIVRLVSIRLSKRHPSVLFAKLINSTAMPAKFRVYRVRLGMLL